MGSYFGADTHQYKGANQCRMNAFVKLLLLFLWPCSLALISNTLYGFEEGTLRFYIIDSVRNTPVEGVHLFYKHSTEGSFTNEDGVAEIEKIEDTLYFSHINYRLEAISSPHLIEESDTVFLIPIEHSLEEIIVRAYDGFDIKAYFKNNRQSISDRYEVKSRLRRCSYKEKVYVEGALVRLYQTQIDWWARKSHSTRGLIKDKNEVMLRSIDFSKIDDNGPIKSRYMSNEDFFKMTDLKFWLTLLTDFCDDYSVNYVKADDEDTFVSFNTISNQNKLPFSLEECLVVFDKTSNSIKYLKLEMAYPLSWSTYTLEDTTFRYSSKHHVVELSYELRESGKYELVNLNSSFDAQFQFDEEVVATRTDHQLFVLEASKSKGIDKSDQVDLNLPFYKHVPRHDNVNPKMLLTQEELEFLNEKE